MRAELKGWHCPTIDTVESWIPDGNEVVYWLELVLGPEDTDGGDNYLVCVGTPGGLDSTEGLAVAPICSRGPTIVLNEYSWNHVLDAVETHLEACSGDTWAEVQAKLGRVFQWEHQRFPMA